MTYRQTYIAEYATESDAPEISANMEFMGGKLVIVQFGDMNEDLSNLQELRDAIVDSMGTEGGIPMTDRLADALVACGVTL